MSEALRHVRISRSMQYCYMPTGAWVTDATPGPYRPKNALSFHILVAGSCWIELDGQRYMLAAGDVACFPYGSPHLLGSGEAGRLIDPGEDLPPVPWAETPVLDYAGPGPQVRLLCGFVQCDAVNFPLFRALLPRLIHVSTLGPDPDWLAPMVEQIEREVDSPQGGGLALLQRLTEIVLLEVLRRQFRSASSSERGWFVAAKDPIVGRALGLIHADPRRDWSLETLARGTGQSRSALSERFATALDTSPMRYLRDWRLFLSSLRLRDEDCPVIEVALDAGYGSEAAFTRAFSRHFGKPPAEWRRSGRA